MKSLNMNEQDQELSPFEENFSSVLSSASQHLPKIASSVDSWVSDISSYAYGSSSINDSYSPSRHSTISEDNSSTHSEGANLNHFNENLQPMPQRLPNDYQSQLQQHKYSVHSINDNNKSDSQFNKGTKKRNRKAKVPEDEEKRKSFFRKKSNRYVFIPFHTIYILKPTVTPAALKCRQRKKQWLNSLQAQVELLTNDDDQLLMEADALRWEILTMKNSLLVHKDCPQFIAIVSDNKLVDYLTYHPIANTNTTAKNQ